MTLKSSQKKLIQSRRRWGERCEDRIHREGSGGACLELNPKDSSATDDLPYIAGLRAKNQKWGLEEVGLKRTEGGSLNGWDSPSGSIARVLPNTVTHAR